MRLFLAADVPEDLRAQLVELQERLGEVPLDLRLVRPTGIHLTLRFIGEVEQSRTERIVTTLGESAGGCPPPFVLRAAGLGFFPERGAPRVIWVGLEGDRSAAGRLAAALDAALVRSGLPPETRPFMPHLTVARIREARRGDWRGALGRLSEMVRGDLSVDRYHLYESRLGAGGATYHRLATWQLPGGGAM
jgi:2'-5' RNA ligase